MSSLVTLTAPDSLEAEAYRALRTNLLAASADSVALLIASPEPGAGASECACNLAVVCAQAGLAVTLVDGDLREPEVHNWLGIANGEGLAEAIGRAAPPQQQTGPVQGLKIVTAGHADGFASDVVAQSGAGEAFGAVRNGSKIVIVVAPPVLSASDAATLARHVDAALLVLAAGKSRRDDAAAAREVFDRVGLKVLGVVLTGVAPDDASLPYFRKKS